MPAVCAIAAEDEVISVDSLVSSDLVGVADGKEIEGKLTININGTDRDDIISGHLTPVKDGVVASSNANATGDGVLDSSLTALEVNLNGGNIRQALRANSGDFSSKIYGNVVYNINGGSIGIGSGYSGDPLYFIGTGYYAGKGKSSSEVYGNLTINIGRQGGSVDDVYIPGFLVANGTGVLHGDSSVNFNSGTINYVWAGGSYGATIEGDTNLLVGEGASVTNYVLAGGSNLLDSFSCDVEGSTNITIKGSVGTHVYGAHYSNQGAVGKVGGSVNILVDGGSVGGDIKGAIGAVSQGVNISLLNGSVGGNIYGAMDAASSVGASVNINLAGDSNVGGTIYGSYDGASVAGQKTLNIGTSEAAYTGTGTLKVADIDLINVSNSSSAKIDSISQQLSGEVLGSRTLVSKGASLEVVGDVENNIVNGTNTGSFVGGLTGGNAVVGGTVKTTIDGDDTSLHFVYGGNGGNQQVVLGRTVPIGESKVGAVDLTVNGGKIDMIVGSGAMYSDVEGDVNISIKGGDVTDIYGSASGAKIGGDVNISVENVSVGSITAGGCGTYGEASVISGSTNIFLGDGANVRTDVYGGGWGDGASWPTRIEGGSNITLVGSASVDGVIYGGGWDPTYDAVAGQKTLNIGTSEAAYTGTGTLRASNLDSLNVVNAASVSFEGSLDATSISVASGSTMNLIVSGQNFLTSDALTLTNEGTIALISERGLAAGEYKLSASEISDMGNVKAYGGTFANNTFSAAAVQTIVLDEVAEALNVNPNGRVSVVDSNSGEKIQMSFNSESASINSVETITDSLIEVIGEDYKAMAAYAFDVAMNSGDSLVLSFLIGDSSLTLADFSIYHRGEGGEWTEADDISGLNYDGEYLSFITSHFSDYGYAAVPEPATLAAIFAFVALLFAAYRKRR